MSINLVALEESLDRGTATRAVSTARSHRARNVAPVGHGSESISRSELKFSISEDKAARIREAAWLVMARDPHCSPEGSYEVHTVYLDSPDMAIYRKSLNREADRFKLRMRFYDDDPTSPVFLEIKRTANGRGIKKRFAVDRESANSLFASDNVSNVSNSAAFAEYWEIVSLFNARPIIHIGYVREAFVGKDNPGTRLTLDRMIHCQPAPTTLTTAMQNPIQIWQGKVILEIKFVGDIPRYLHDLIRSFGLEAAKASKYMESVSSRFANETELPFKSKSWQTEKTRKLLGHATASSLHK
jgi:hypothetical protein